MKTEFRKRICLLLAALMLLTLLPETALAEQEKVPIDSFSELIKELAEQTVPAGTTQKELNLPEGLTAVIAGRQTETTINVAGWESDPVYDLYAVSKHPGQD